MKKIGKTIAIGAATIAGGLLVVFVLVLFDVPPEAVRVGVTVLSVCGLCVALVLFIWYIRVAFSNARDLQALLDATLEEAAGSKKSQLQAKTYAVLLRAQGKAVHQPCFLGLTNTRLLAVLMTSAYEPIQELCFGVEDITFCRIRKSLVPSQYVIKLRFGKSSFSFRVYRTVFLTDLSNQEKNMLELLNGLARYDAKVSKEITWK